MDKNKNVQNPFSEKVSQNRFFRKTGGEHIAVKVGFGGFFCEHKFFYEKSYTNLIHRIFGGEMGAFMDFINISYLLKLCMLILFAYMQYIININSISIRGVTIYKIIWARSGEQNNML